MKKTDTSSNTPNKLLLVFLSSIILLSPIPFGSVHLSTFTLWGIVIAVVWLFLIRDKSFSLPQSIKPILYSLGVVLLFGILNATFHLIFSPAAPVEGVQAFTLEPVRFVNFILSLSSIALLITIASQLNPKEQNKICSIGIASGVIVSTIALMHWLSDNGRLFWIFEPSFIFETNRARWPFVNSNHLGAFLIIPYFLCLSRFVSYSQIINKSLEATRFSSYLSSTARILKIKDFPTTVAYGVALIWIGIAITATLSRAVVSSVVILTVITVIFDASRNNTRTRKIIYWAFGLIVLVGAMILVDQSELIQSRLYYKLIASKDDIRWQMYEESIPLLSLLGVGFGGWERSFFQIASPAFVGLNPEYLHSDILQFAIESGILCVFIILFLLRGVIKDIFVSIYSTSSKYYAAGIIGVFLAACFDFPFRMPSILWIFSIFLVIWIQNLHYSQLKDRSN